MEICKICNKKIPYKDLIFQEYLALNERLNKVKNNNIKYKFFKNLTIELQNKTGDEFCFCLENLKNKKDLLEKNIKLLEKLKEQKKSLIKFELNKSLNIVGNKLEIKKLFTFLKQQSNYMVYNKNYYPHYILSYEELKNKIKEFIELKETFKLEEYKQSEILIIYNYDKILNNEPNYIDDKILSLIEDRYLKNLTTYIIYDNQKITNSFNKIINNINNNKYLKFYENIKYESKKILEKQNEVLII